MGAPVVELIELTYVGGDTGVVESLAPLRLAAQYRNHGCGLSVPGSGRKPYPWVVNGS